MDTLRVRHAELKDIGPFFDLTVPFPCKPGINLICGDNGIGKTTLLEAIAAGFSYGYLERLKRRQAANEGLIRLKYSLNDVDQLCQVKIDKFEPDQNAMSLNRLNLSHNVIHVRAVRDFSYIRRESITRDPTANSQNLIQRLSAGLNADEIKIWFSNRYLLKPHSTANNWTPEMLENLASAEDFFSLLDPSVKLDRVDVRTFDIIVSTPSGLIPFEYLSSGFRSAYILLLGIIKEIEFRGLNVSAKDFAGVIIIDEIELHLHPTWQREIGNAIKNAFPKAQIIATTHSPHVIQAAHASEVIALVRDQNGKVSARPVPSTQYGYAGWTLEEVLEDIMGVQDTKTPLFREAMQKFDSAIDDGASSEVIRSLNVLREMLHPNNPLRKLIEIQAAPHIGAEDLDEVDE